MLPANAAAEWPKGAYFGSFLTGPPCPHAIDHVGFISGDWATAPESETDVICSKFSDLWIKL